MVRRVCAVEISKIIDLVNYPISDREFRAKCRDTINSDGVLVLKDFMQSDAVEQVRLEGLAHQDEAYFCTQKHNVYLSSDDPCYADDHVRNRAVVSSKGCITDDQIPSNSPLHLLYDSNLFKDFLCSILGEAVLYEYADPLSSINLHYAKAGQELGWHFDNSSFATTLMIQEPDAGGQFQFVSDMRDSNQGEMNFEGVAKVLDGEIAPKQLDMPSGALVLFRGRDAIHRVAPVMGSRTRMLAVLAYNTEPGIALSELARMTFFGRLD